MLKSKIQFVNGKPMIAINGENYSPFAYTTYFDECGKWNDFIKIGCKMFFVNISFTDLPINNSSGFTPFRTGVFETDTPDYTEFEETVRSILADCPDAFIFPRINIAMPRWWIAANPYETVDTPNGGARESLYSDKFRNDGAELLKALVAHIRSSDYAGRIAGYQLCGGTTQEWMHHDLFSSYSQIGTEKFKEWARKKYGIADIEAPTKEELDSGISTEAYRKYCEFCNETVALTVEHFAKTLKEITDEEQIAGVFYGYSGYVNNPLYGLHALSRIISSPYIDFFSSPCCYDSNRNLGVDWGDMIPVDSIKLYGKLCFIECDIRTHLTRSMHESRPGLYPENICATLDGHGNKTVWSGPDTPEESVSAIRKAFAHQVTKASGIWWFDMWGGWYHSEEMMAEIENLRTICETIKHKSTNGLPQAETAVFIDEKAYANISKGNELCHTVNHIRIRMSHTGIPFDLYLVEDAGKVITNYRAAVFTAPIPSPDGIKAIEACKKHSIPYISSTEEKPFYSTGELRDFLVSHGVHCYDEDKNVFYCGNGIVGIHTVCDGEVKINLPVKYKVKDLSDSQSGEYTTDRITFTAPKHTTKIFGLDTADSAPKQL